MPRQSFLKNLFHRPHKTRKPQPHPYADLVNAESALGRTLFGPIPAGHQREFFNHRKNVWIWHESWVDEHGILHQNTVRYEVRPGGVFKKINQGQYSKIQGKELSNFRQAAHAYLNLIKQKLYN